MQYRPTRWIVPKTAATRAAAVLAAVAGSILGASPHAISKSTPDRPATDVVTADTIADAVAGADAQAAPDTAHAYSSGVPQVYPRPQSIRARGQAVAVTASVALVARPDADRYAVAAVSSLLRSAGARVTTIAPGTAYPDGRLLVFVDGSTANAALRALGAPVTADLPAGGYALATGRAVIDGAARDVVALRGADADGTFYGAQTLRQLLVTLPGEAGSEAAGSGRLTSGFPGVVVRDWPSTAVRGIVEGFYGEPWSLKQRLAQLDFMGRTKQNRYLYAPGDDPYRQSMWRQEYPDGQRRQLRALADRAKRNHVTLAWAVSPGQSFCFASDTDLDALAGKLESMWGLGVRAFQLQFADVSYTEWQCSADQHRYGDGPAAAAAAQADVANEISRRLAARHPGAAPLSLLPTEFYEDGDTEYRTALGAALDPDIQVGWTGVRVVPPKITGTELAGTRSAFADHPLLTMDNYPVNDYTENKIFQAPVTGREPAVASASAGYLANAMRQPVASQVALFTSADFAWNPSAYRAEQSWQAALNELAGGDAKARQALAVVAGNAYSSPLDGTESAYLSPLLRDFWNAASGDSEQQLAVAGRRLRAAFQAMSAAPGRLTGVARGAYVAETRPWLDQLARYGKAGSAAIDMILAQRRGDGDEAWRKQLVVRDTQRDTKRATATVGAGVLDTFLDKALNAADDWTGVSEVAATGRTPATASMRAAVDGNPATSYRGPAGPAAATDLTVTFGATRPLDRVTVLTDPKAATHASVDVRLAGGEWQPIGELGVGWTELAAGGVQADAVRLRWAAGATPPTVNEVVPWFADTPVAKLKLGRSSVNAEIGGAPATVEATLAATRAGMALGHVAAVAPEGVRVAVSSDTGPEPVTLPRGGQLTTRLKVTVPAATPPGEYSVPVRFTVDGQTVEQRLTVRAYPPTSGPDVARGATATSSGDETEDFPASAAVDGDPDSRWSSPADDDAWLQVQLAEPTRVGRLVLRWQDAYAAAYRVETSADGQHWSAAATVNDGRGGTEEIRLDAPGTSFVRIQGIKRATQYGYSLYAVEVYAVDARR